MSENKNYSTKQLIEQLKNEHNNKKELIKSVHSSDIAYLLTTIEAEDRDMIFAYINDEKMAEIISYMEDETIKDITDWFSIDKIAVFLNYLATDDAVDILNTFSAEYKERVFSLMENEKKIEDIKSLLYYEEDTAGSLMQKEVIKANNQWTIERCIKEIRIQAMGLDKILTVYVVDDNQVLLGRISLKKIILSPANMLIKNLLIEDIISVETHIKIETVVEYMQKYDLEAIPVVNFKNKLVGRITFDDVMDAMSDQAESNTKAMTGITEITEGNSIWELTKSRVPWLLVGIIGGLLGAKFIELFKEDLILIPAIAFFIPLINATGGNVGIQSSSIIIQKLSREPLENIHIYKLIGKILYVALLNGVIIGITVLLFSIYFNQNNYLAIIVSFSIFCVILLSSLTGTLTPIILEKFNFNPALAAGPFITTINDILGLSVYFTITHIFIEQI